MFIFRLFELNVGLRLMEGAESCGTFHEIGFFGSIQRKRRQPVSREILLSVSQIAYNSAV